MVHPPRNAAAINCKPTSTRCSTAGATNGISSAVAAMPVHRKTANPTDMMFSCGATRDTTAMAMLIASMTATTGSARMTPSWNNAAPDAASAPQPAGTMLAVTATGTIWKLLTSAAISNRCPPMARNNTVPSRSKKSAMAGIGTPTWGLSSVAKPKPICRPLRSPANAITDKATRMAKPIAAPTRICSKTRTIVCHDRSSGAIGPATPPMIAATAKPSATFTGAGTALEPKAGAKANSARPRSNGQTSRPSQCAMSPSVRASMMRLRPVGGLRYVGHEIGRQPRAHPRQRQRRNQQDDGEARHETQGQVGHARADLDKAHHQAHQQHGSERRTDQDQRFHQHAVGRERQHVAGQVHEKKPCASEPITSIQPLTSTNTMSFSGSDTVTGDNSIMPSDIITAATTISITMNGRKIRRPIWNAVRSSDVKKAGATKRIGTSSALS